MTVVVTARFRPVAGREADVLAAIGRAIPEVHREAGCERYAITTGSHSALMMIERWSDAAALDAHGAGPAVAALNTALDGLLVAPVEVERWEPVTFGDGAKGVI